ncbi:hypothetical protein CMI47_12005 [Candidatus Pacearchaeota archaeon]|nr:hypothetical protein [Candidatus Pacearchaeota archaeon]|tara:strand:- start:8708 stop:9661 length:954 start_codon:yes stop_codon:yes gene_type:complete
MEEQVEINDLIFKELLKRGYSLEGNTRIWNIADSKLWYLTQEQSQAFLDLEKSGDYQKDVIQKEIDLINDNLDKLLKEIGKDSINILDLGCGDGKKAVIFIEKLKGKVKVRYCPIDISDYMVEKAFARIKKMNVEEVVEFQWNISDFENLENITNLLRSGNGYHGNLILLLGNTLGNFEINEFLYEVRSSMGEDDVLLIGNGLDNRKTDEILKSYDNKPNKEFLVQILTQIGFNEKDLEYGTRFENSRVELFFTVKKDVTLGFLEKKIDFSKGDQIVVAVSYKYDQDDFKSFVKMYFNESEVFVSKDESYALALCKK